MDEQENPFKQFRPTDSPPQKEIETQVMGSIHMKSYMASVLEFFSAILSITLKESIVGRSDKKQTPKKSTDKLDNFF